MGRYAHDSAGAVVGQYVVGQPDGKLSAIHGIDGIASGKYAGFFFVLDAIYVGAHGGTEDVVFYGLPRLLGGQILCDCVLWGQYHEGGAVEGVGAGGVDGDLLFSSFYGEVYLCAVGFSDPVGLHFLYFFRPVQFVQIA